LKKGISNLYFPKNLYDNPILIDRYLAGNLIPLCPEKLIVLGVSINLPGGAGPSGGIIGNPHREVFSARGEFEDIGCGLTLFARPEGPGIVFSGGISQRESLRKNLLNIYDRDNIIALISNMAKTGKFRLVMAIFDGTPSLGGGYLYFKGKETIELLD
jgi:hypothetical protein